MKRLKTAVIGAGKMGSLHSRIYSQMDQVELVAIVDTQKDKAQQLADKYGCKALDNPTEILEQVDAVTISVPTEFHSQVAMPFLSRGIAVLVEKPLAETLQQGRGMLEMARQNNCILQVGYSERFNPVVQAMRRLDISPRFMEAYRISPFTFRSTDVGVVLDMMIHDIDIVLSLAQSKIKDVHAVGVHVLGQHEDVANVRLTFENGCVANLTASRLALKTERKIRVFSEDSYLSLDYLKKTGSMISKASNIDMIQSLREQINEDGEIDLINTDWAKLVNIELLDIDDREPLRLEQEAFIQAIIDGTKPQVSGQDAIDAMELAQQIVKVITEHRWESKDSVTISAQEWLTKEPKASRRKKLKT